MDQALELLNVSEVQSFSPLKETTIKALLEELGLEGKCFGVLINGKKTEINQRVLKTDEIVILPQIAGGEDDSGLLMMPCLVLIFFLFLFFIIMK